MRSIYFCLIMLLYSNFLWAYPEMVRHGYTSCVTCHLSPGGGGILTPYGRSIANELLTHHWSDVTNPKETDEASNEVVSKWLKGGDARVLLFHRNNEYEDSYSTIPMQLELSGAYATEKYAFVLSAAATGSRSGSGEGSTGFIVPNAYGLYRFWDELSFRAGRFLPAYGLNNSLHTIGTRGPMGFGFKDQRFGAELSYIADRWGVFVSQFGDRGDHLGDSASSLQVQYSPTERSKLAVNVWSESKLRDLYGAWFVVPLTEKVYISADYNSEKNKVLGTNGTYYFGKLGYEFSQGLHVYVMNDFSQKDKDRNYTKVERYGPGFQLFPFLHWEIDAVWMKEKNLTYSKKEADYAYILAHYYF